MMCSLRVGFRKASSNIKSATEDRVYIVHTCHATGKHVPLTWQLAGFLVLALICSLFSSLLVLVGILLSVLIVVCVCVCVCVFFWLLLIFCSPKALCFFRWTVIVFALAPSGFVRPGSMAISDDGSLSSVLRIKMSQVLESERSLVLFFPVRNDGCRIDVIGIWKGFALGSHTAGDVNWRTLDC